MYTTVQSLAELCRFYEQHMKEPCLPCCLEELCGGWTTETYKQILIKMTGNGMVYVPLVFHDPSEMQTISSKSQALAETFKLFDTQAFSRVDAVELLTALSFVCSGDLEQKMENCFFLIGMRDEAAITKEEFQYFLDNLVRGISKVALLTNDTFYPRDPNKRLSEVEIFGVASKLFTNRPRAVTPGEFCQWLDKEGGALAQFLKMVSFKFQDAQQKNRELMISRLKLIPFIKTFLYNSIIKRIGQ